MKLKELYQALLDKYGYQNWWPVDLEYHKKKDTDPRDEVIISAVLTQNTSWKNVEKSLENLKKYGELSLDFVRKVSTEKLQELIRPSGYYKIKAQRLKEVAKFLNPTDGVKEISREELLNVKGIGKETADVILLYAGERLSFVIDKYTQRFVERFYGIRGKYEELKAFFEENLPKDIEVYKEFHALIDEHAKRFCRKHPECEGCFLRSFCLNGGPSF